MISYCWADTQFVLGKLAPALSKVVESLWLDRLGGDQGMGEWTRLSMNKGVEGSDVIVSVVSPKYIQSINCGFEMELAAKYEKVLIPLMLGVPFSEWPPTVIGETPMTSQFKDESTGDMKLFVDFSDMSAFATKFNKELLPRLDKPMNHHTRDVNAPVRAESTRPSKLVLSDSSVELTDTVKRLTVHGDSSLEHYSMLVQMALLDDTVDSKEQGVLDAARKRFGITEEQHKAVVAEIIAKQASADLANVSRRNLRHPASLCALSLSFSFSLSLSVVCGAPVYSGSPADRMAALFVCPALHVALRITVPEITHY